MSNERNLKAIGLHEPRKGGKAFADLVSDGANSPATEKDFRELLEACASNHIEHMRTSGLFKQGYLFLYRDLFTSAAMGRWDELDGEGMSIHPDCPPGVMVMGENGRPKITNYGMGLMMGDLAIQESRTEAEAIQNVQTRMKHGIAVMRDGGYEESTIQAAVQTRENAALMKIREHYRGTGQAEGVA